MTLRNLVVQAWDIYQKLVSLDIERRKSRNDRRSRHRDDFKLVTGYSGRRHIRRSTRLHLLIQRAYKRYKRRLEACMRN